VVVRVVHRVLEPRVLVGRVPGDEVQQHPDAAPPGGVDQLREVVTRAVARVDREVVGHVVAGVAHR
jgi:hypothetical protein